MFRHIVSNAPAALVLSAAVLLSACGGDSSAASASESTSGATSATVSEAPATPGSSAAVQAPEVLVYKSSSCTCCQGWVEHLREEGFDVRVENREDIVTVKNLLGIPQHLRSCHTAQVGDYLVEGHVPASDVERLLAEGRQVAGLAVPGMPVGSPGMEVPGRAADRYQVLTFDAQGDTEVYASH